MGVEAFMEFNGTQKNANGMPQAQPAPRPQGAGRSGMGSNGKVVMIGVAALVVLVLVGLCVWMWKGKDDNGAGFVKGGQYQAVFLTNGQVYFGKLALSGDTVSLTDIYYLQVQQSVQPADKNATQSPQVSLAKLGSELHGPEDQMVINRDQVLFWENLKNDGKVVNAIEDSKK